MIQKDKNSHLNIIEFREELYGVSTCIKLANILVYLFSKYIVLKDQKVTNIFSHR